KRARERDLVVRARPAACGDAELLHIAAGVVTADRVDSELPAAGLELQRRDRIRPAERRRADQPWSPGHCRRVGAAVVCDLQVSTLLCVEGGLVGIMRLRQKREGHGSGANGEECGDENDPGLKAPPPEVCDGLDQNGRHRDVSSLRRRTTSAAGRSVVSSRASSTIFPSVTLITRAEWRVASLASWVTSRI